MTDRTRRSTAQPDTGTARLRKERTTAHTPARITRLEPNEVFVFGSNAGGMHGGGAARTAYEKFGAVWGQANGLQGQSYGIDTMSGLRVLASEVSGFLGFAREHPHLTFLVTEIGCGIAGYRPKQIAPFFADVPPNVVLPATFDR
ncbi:A1S_2505 family phage non-structural protein [Subtercola sp. YIM 133946]|uniref:A1S_2505 family phage non-structural protein n=1 Tax=Subtercola sp. YIM 133946 TaxID=3118909 RepID=UPI002F933AC2